MDKKIPENIVDFLVNMLHQSDEFGYGEYIPDELLQSLYGKLDEQISSYLLAKLSNEKLTEYRTLKERGESAEGLDVFFMKNIPDYKDIMKKAYRDFYEGYLEQVKSEREQRLKVNGD